MTRLRQICSGRRSLIFHLITVSAGKGAFALVFSDSLRIVTLPSAFVDWRDASACPFSDGPSILP